MRRHLTSMAFASILALAFNVNAENAASENALPELEIPILQNPPKLDGVIDDACWKNAARIDAFHVVGENRKTNEDKVWVGRDNAWLYAAFEVNQPECDREPAKVVKRDDYVQREDNVQLSFDPGTNGELYYQFLLSKANARADFRMTRAKGREREGWNIPWRSATRRTAANWTAEMAVPLCLLVEHGDLSKARLNLLIDRFIPIRDQCLVQMGRKKIESSWAPLKTSFHEPERFGAIKNLRADAIKAPFLPFLETAGVRQYYFKNGAGFYDVAAVIKPMTGAAGDIVLRLIDQPVSGQGARVEQKTRVLGNADAIDVKIPVPVKSMIKRTAVLEMVDAANGEILERVLLDDTAALDLFSAYLDRNYYTTETAARGVCSVRLPAENLVGARLRASDDKGETLAETNRVKPETILDIPLAKTRLGVNAIAIALVSPTGDVLSDIKVDLVRRAPKPGVEWKVDRVNLRLLRDGKPFFPFGLIMGGVKPEQESAFAKVASGHFNTVAQWAYGSTDINDAKRYLDVTAKYGLNVIANPEQVFARFDENVRLTGDGYQVTPEQLKAANDELRRSYYPLSIGMKDVLLDTVCKGLPLSSQSLMFLEFAKKTWPQIEPAVNILKDAPNLIGYFMLDEPMTAENMGGQYLYERFNAADGYHPIFTLYSCDIPDDPESLSWFDMLGVDPYWNIRPGNERGAPIFVSKVVARAARRAAETHIPNWTIPVASSWSQTFKRPTTPEEQKLQTYLALMNGSKGIVYFTFATVCSETVWNGLAEMAEQMKTLGPICLEPDVPRNVTYSTGPFDPENEKFTDVEVSLKTSPAGGYVLLAGNVHPYPVETEISVSFLKDGDAFGRLFADDAYVVRNGNFKERLEAYAVRAYTFNPATPPATPIRISVKTVPREDLAEKEFSFTKAGRIGRKNILPNPSFEESSLKGAPDYYTVVAASPLPPDEWVGAPNRAWGTDTAFAKTGKQSVKITRGHTGYTILEPKVDYPRNYVFSAWIKANRDRVNAGIQGRGSRKNVTVGEKWQRVFVTVPMPAGTPSSFLRFDIAKDGNREGDAIWVDDAQFEPGDQPTEFEP